MMKKHLFVFTVVMFALLFCITLYPINDYGQIRCAETDEKKVALTFDDGPHFEKTDKILDLLSKYNIKASFFVVGENVKAYPQIVKREVNEGHELGNHTETHVYASRTKYNQIKKQILNTHSEVFDITGINLKYIRPPGGDVTRSIADISNEMGYKMILWNIDTEDWAHTNTSDIVSNIKTNIKPGSIILFHDYITGESHTLEALEEVIPYLTDKGYTFCKISELVE